MPEVPIRDAVTAVLRHAGEIFMVRRQPALVAFPGYWAFPGGKVDAEDHAAPARTHDGFRDMAPHLAQALVRELREEIRFDLDQAAREGGVLSVQAMGSALTPSFVPVRFDTQFYCIDLAARPAVELDIGEVDDCRWATPTQLIAEYETGRLLLAPPTRAALVRLVEHPADQPVPSPLELHHRERHPVLEPLQGLRMIAVRSHTLPPAIHTNCFLIGDEGADRILVDPSPWNEAELDGLIERVRPYGIAEVFLTHHHPDHRERANQLAQRLGVPMASSADTRARIERAEPGYFEGVAHRVVGEGDEVSRWQGEPVRVLAVPGHDEGQLALMPESRAWCIVGDLIQGVGTVVIHKPEGHMGRYFASLERLIALDPAVIVPSHGVAMGTVHRLSETLAHRRLREEAVLNLHRQRRSVDEMLDQIYGKELMPVLRPLARQNIEAHLEKLQEEGRLAVA